jgi:hypothetical protein
MIHHGLEKKKKKLGEEEKVTAHFHHDAAMKEKVENMLHGVNKTL